jgi:hypothetical protein
LEAIRKVLFIIDAHEINAFEQFIKEGHGAAIQDFIVFVAAAYGATEFLSVRLSYFFFFLLFLSHFFLAALHWS